MHSTSVETTVSSVWSPNGSRCARASITCALRSLRRTAFSKPLAHRRVRLCEHEAVEDRQVVEEIQAGAAADLQGLSARLGEEGVAVAAHAGALADPQERLIRSGEHACPGARVDDGTRCKVSVVMPATVRPGPGRASRNGHWRRMARSGDRRIRRGSEPLAQPP